MKSHFKIRQGLPLNKANIRIVNTDQVPEVEEPQIQAQRTTGRWTSEEHDKFLEALEVYGKNWKKVENHIGTRSGAQIRSHAQKFFGRLQRMYPDKDPLEV